MIRPDDSYCALESVVGPFRFIISGRINAWQPQEGVLDFQFTAVDILLLGNKVRWRRRLRHNLHLQSCTVSAWC